MNLWLSDSVKTKYGGRPGFKSCRLLKISASTWPFCMALSPMKAPVWTNKGAFILLKKNS